MVNLGSLIASLGVDSTSLKKAQQDMDRFEKQTNKTVASVNSNLKSMGRSMDRFGKKASKNLTVPLVAAAAASTKLFADYESSLAKVNGLVGVAQAQVDEWGADMLKIAPKLGTAPAALADGLFFVTSAGIKGAEAMEVLTTSAKASAAGLGEVKVVADLVTSAMNAYGKENLNAQIATDILVSAVREGKAEASALAASLGSVLPIASQMGVTFDQVGASVAAMTRTGTDAATASTQLRQILNSLLKPTKQAEKALNGMGTSSKQLRRTIKEDGLLAALMDINKLTKAYGEETVASVFPNIRALSGVLDIMGNNLEDNIKVFDNMKDSTGALSKAFDSAAKTTTFKFNAAMAQGKVSLTALGKEVSAALLPILESLVGSLKSVTEWFTSLSPVTKQIIVSLGGFLAVVGPLSIAIGFLATTVLPGLVMIGGKAILMFNALKVAIVTNPIGALATILVSVAASMLFFSRNTKKAATAQKELNEMVLDGQKLLQQTFKIEDQVKAIEILNKRQLEGLENRIANQIKIEEDFSTKLKIEAKKRLAEDVQLNKIKERLANVQEGAFSDALTQSLKSQGAIREAALMRDLEKENNVNKIRLNALNVFLGKVKKQIESIKSSEGGTDNSAQIAKILDSVIIKETTIQRLTQAMGSAYDSASEKSELYATAIRDLITAGVDPASISIQNLSKKLNALGDAQKTSLTAFANMKVELNAIEATSNVLGSSYDSTSAKLSVFSNVLQKAAKDGKLTDTQLTKLKNSMTALNLEASKKTIGKQLAWIGQQAEMSGSSFDANSAKIEVYTQALKNLWEQGFRPGDAAFDNMRNNLTSLQNSAQTTVSLTSQMEAFASSFRSIGQAIGASSNSWTMWTANVLGSIPTIIAGLQAVTATQRTQTAVAGVNAVANATASGAQMPFPLNIAAIAAGVAAVVAALATVPKMAKGGIIPGGFPNDSFPAMLQSGEAVIPLDRLDSMMNNRSTSTSSKKATFVIKGRTLQAVLDEQDKYNKAF